MKYQDLAPQYTLAYILFFDESSSFLYPRTLRRGQLTGDAFLPCPVGIVIIHSIN